MKKPVCPKLDKPIGDVKIGECLKFCKGTEQIAKCLDTWIKYELTLKYELIFVCPNCGYKITQRRYDTNPKKCSKCQTQLIKKVIINHEKTT